MMQKIMKSSTKLMKRKKACKSHSTTRRMGLQLTFSSEIAQVPNQVGEQSGDSETRRMDQWQRSGWTNFPEQFDRGTKLKGEKKSNSVNHRISRSLLIWLCVAFSERIDTCLKEEKEFSHCWLLDFLETLHFSLCWTFLVEFGILVWRL